MVRTSTVHSLEPMPRLVAWRRKSSTLPLLLLGAQFNPSTPLRNTSYEFQTYQLGIGGPCQHFTPAAGCVSHVHVVSDKEPFDPLMHALAPICESGTGVATHLRVAVPSRT
jgi:hypothetical protein